MFQVGIDSPGPHDVHEASPAALKVPFAHASHVVAPVAEEVPARHGVCAAAAGSATKKPAFASVQLDEPSPGANLPATHLTCFVARGLSTKCPCSARVHSAAAALVA